MADTSGRASWVAQFAPDRFVLRLLAVIIGIGTGAAVGAGLKNVTGGYVADAIIAGFVAAAPFWVGAIAVRLLAEIADSLRE